MKTLNKLMKLLAYRPWSFGLPSSVIFILLFFSCVPHLIVVPDDLEETVGMTARCTYTKPGTFTISLNAPNTGDGTLSPASGTPVTVNTPPYRAQSTFNPNITGRSRPGLISCYHSASPGRPGRARFKVRERKEPTVVQFVAPATANVGQTFAVQVDITDDPAGPGQGEESGLDKIFVLTTGPLWGPGVIELAGVVPGPPDGVKGPRRYNANVDVTCMREGDASIKLLALDAARNQVFSARHEMACVNP